MLTSVYTRARLGTGPDMSDSLAAVWRPQCLEVGGEVGARARGRGALNLKGVERSRKGRPMPRVGRGGGTVGTLGQLTEKGTHE